jgi:hypothetical protein
VYACAECKSTRVYMIECGPPQSEETGPPGAEAYRHFVSWIRKVGQYPPWEQPIERSLEKALETHLSLYKRGLACEHEGFGIGAVAYLRRIVEDVIWDLLRAKAASLSGDARMAFDHQVEALKRDWSGSGAIELVKDRLPAEARPGGANPLGMLYGELSGALHTMSEEECAATVGELREFLAGLLTQVSRTAESLAFSRAVEAMQQKRSAKGKA